MDLPWLLAMLAKRIRPEVEREATTLLENKSLGIRSKNPVSPGSAAA
jgi:hypothetical protein